MKTIKLKTKEPIKINLNISEHGNDHSIELIYKGQNYLYVFITQASTVTIDLDQLRYWIEETYYDLSFTSCQYIPCELRAEDFKK